MSSTPRVSVVVATRNRADRLAALLESLRRQTLDPEAFEVVVVDDASDDGRTSAVLAAAAAHAAPTPLRVVRRPRRGGPAAARNDGWQAARGRIVAFTDDDCVAAPDWLAAGLSVSESRPGALVQGRTEPLPAELGDLGPFTRTLRVEGLGPYFQTCNIFYPRAVLERVGGFDDAFGMRACGEDADLAWRAIAAGTPSAFAPDARVFHGVVRLGPTGKLKVAFALGDSMLPYVRHPQLRAQVFNHRWFWKATHYGLARALVALVLPRRLKIGLGAWLVGIYAGQLRVRFRTERTSPLLAPYIVLHDLVEMWAVIRAAARHRTLLL